MSTDKSTGMSADMSTDMPVDIAADTRLIRRPLSIGGISVSVGGLSVDCRWSIGRLSVVYRSTVL